VYEHDRLLPLRVGAVNLLLLLIRENCHVVLLWMCRCRLFNVIVYRICEREGRKSLCKNTIDTPFAPMLAVQGRTSQAHYLFAPTFAAAWISSNTWTGWETIDLHGI
jgi:hypothetical protein